MADAAPNRSLVKPLALLALVVASVLVIYVSPLHELLLPGGFDKLQAAIADLGLWGPIGYVVISALAIGIGAPRLVFSVVGGIVFGWWWGFLLAHVGTVLGCTIAFSWARWLGRGWVTRRMGGRLSRLLGRVKQHPIATNVLIRICPVGNNFATNIFFGVAPVHTKDFVVGTFLGSMPETFIYALFGSSAEHASTRRLLAGAAMLALMTLTWFMLSRSSKDAAEIARRLSDRDGNEDEKQHAAGSGSEDGTAAPQEPEQSS